MKTVLIAAAVAASVAASVAAAPAFAQPGDESRIAVRVADLDLRTAEGRSTLELRLLHAARTACGTPSPADPLGAASLDDCAAAARAAAFARRDAIVAAALRQSPPPAFASRRR